MADSKSSSVRLPRPVKRFRTLDAAASIARTQNVSTLTSAPVNTPVSVGSHKTPARSESDSVPGATATKKRKSRGVRKAERAIDTTGETRPRSRRKREPTPEDAELIEIAPASVKMSELCKDIRTGKISKRETEIRNMELAKLERRQKEREETESPSNDQVKENGHRASPSDTGRAGEPLGTSQSGLQMRLVDGMIVLDTESLHVDRHADPSRDVGDLEDVVENQFTRKINQASFGKRTKTQSWDEEMTDLFYRGLRMFGTDFMMICRMFPGRSRREIKLKFNNEERRDPDRIKEALMGPREAIDITTYSEITNTVYEDPQVIQQELDEEKRRIEDQHVKEKEAQEELLRNPSGKRNDNTAPGVEDTNPNTQKGKTRNTKKSSAVNSKVGGSVEILGSIDDLPMSEFD
jgi:transcription factor TFIIIB component B''